jgi:hypothetical protein
MNTLIAYCLLNSDNNRFSYFDTIILYYIKAHYRLEAGKLYTEKANAYT